MTAEVRAPQGDWVLRNAFLAELEANSQMCLEAWNELRSLTTRHPRPGPNDEEQAAMRQWMYSVWGRAYSMVAAGRRLTLVLWSWNGAKALRSGLNGPIPPALAKNAPVVATRDAMEHTETRVLEFASQTTDLPLSGWGVTNDPKNPGRLTATQFRHLNFRTWDCAVRDSEGEHRCNLSDLAEAVRKLKFDLPPGIGGTSTVVRLPP